MTDHLIKSALVLAILAPLSPLTSTAAAKDWPMWGKDFSRNMFSAETGLPDDFIAGEFGSGTDSIDMATTKNVRWIAKLGSQTYGNPTVANGRVYVGTNNDSPRDKRFQGDRSVVLCLTEATGELLWQLNIPKLGTGKVSDWEFLGICSSPAVDGDRVYFVTNRCEVICLDVHGMENGNDGPYQDEGQYMAGPGNEKMEVTSTDADIIWVMNMIDECGVFPHNITSSSVLVVGDRVWVSTSNGVDYGHVETPAPFAPCLILLDKNTGELLGEEDSGLSQRILHGNWVSPGYLKTDDLELCIFGGPDGVCYAFEPEPAPGEDGFALLKEAWRFDVNKAEFREKDGKPVKYATRNGPSEVLGTPVTHNGRVYTLIGQDPEHGEGVGRLVCIDPSKRGDITDSGLIWAFDDINRSVSTLSITDDGLLFAADFSGFIYCLEAETGKFLWKHDTFAHIWGSTLVADNKVYVGNEDGILTVIPATREYEQGKVKEFDMTSPVYSSPIVANGVLYVATHTHLFAIARSTDE